MFSLVIFKLEEPGTVLSYAFGHFLGLKCVSRGAGDLMVNIVFMGPMGPRAEFRHESWIKRTISKGLINLRFSCFYADIVPISPS